MNPSNNIYQCVSDDCDKYHQKSANNELYYALYFLQVDKIKHLFEFVKKESNIFSDFESKVQNNLQEDFNILDHIFFQLLTYTSGNYHYPTLDNACFYIKNDSYKKRNRKAYQKIIEIIEIICKKFPHLITERHFEKISLCPILVLK